jgi:hypothetical protein
MRTRILTFLLLAIIFTSCNNEKIVYQDDVVIDQENYIPFVQENFTIHYPNSWMIEKYPLTGVSFYLYMDKEEDEFKENVNLMINPNIKNWDLKQYVQASIKKYEELGGKILSSEKIITPTQQYHKLITISESNGEKMKYIQHLHYTPSQFYVLTFTAQEKDFAKYEKEVEQVMKSFSLK